MIKVEQRCSNRNEQKQSRCDDIVGSTGSEGPGRRFPFGGNGIGLLLLLRFGGKFVGRLFYRRFFGLRGAGMDENGIFAGSRLALYGGSCCRHRRPGRPFIRI